jgi:hypothetical protein
VVPVEPVGRCIYCGKTDPAPARRFTDEHVVPYAFGGNLVLPEASCLKCQHIINKEIETPVLSGDWGNLREKYRMPTRGRSGRTHVASSDHSGRRMMIPIDDYPAIVPFWSFGTARLINGSQNLQRRQISLLGDSDGVEDRACKTKHPTWNGTYSIRVRFDAYARLLAKVAYSWVVATSGTGWFRESITPIIRGIEKDFTTHVGGLLDGYGANDENDEPSFLIQTTGNGTGLVIFQSKLITGHPISRYHVVLGECDVEIGDDGRTVTLKTAPTNDTIRIERPPSRQS